MAKLSLIKTWVIYFIEKYWNISEWSSYNLIYTGSVRKVMRHFLFTKVFIFFKHKCYPLQNTSLGQLHTVGDVVPTFGSSAGSLQPVWPSPCPLYVSRTSLWKYIGWHFVLEEQILCGRFPFCQKHKSTLIWSSICSFELSLVEETSQCASPYFSSWSEDHIKNSMIHHHLWSHD